MEFTAWPSAFWHVDSDGCGDVVDVDGACGSATCTCGMCAPSVGMCELVGRYTVDPESAFSSMAGGTRVSCNTCTKCVHTVKT